MSNIDLETKDLFGWFAQRILETYQVRERHQTQTQEDAACTIYLAGLLTHLTSSPWLARLDQEGQRLDMDVSSQASKESSMRARLEAYRRAADRYLLYLGLWDGLQGHQAGRYYQITEDNLARRASAYYGFASDLATRLPPPSNQNAGVFRELALNLGMYLGILLAMRGDVFHLYPSMGAGEEFHLLGGHGPLDSRRAKAA